MLRAGASRVPEAYQDGRGRQVALAHDAQAGRSEQAARAAMAACEAAVGVLRNRPIGGPTAGAPTPLRRAHRCAGAADPSPVGTPAQAAVTAASNHAGALQGCTLRPGTAAAGQDTASQQPSQRRRRTRLPGYTTARSCGGAGRNRAAQAYDASRAYDAVTHTAIRESLVEVLPPEERYCVMRTMADRGGYAVAGRCSAIT